MPNIHYTVNTLYLIYQFSEMFSIQETYVLSKASISGPVIVGKSRKKPVKTCSEDQRSERDSLLQVRSSLLTTLRHYLRPAI